MINPSVNITPLIDRDSIALAEGRINGHVRRTPVFDARLQVPHAQGAPSRSIEVNFKLEHLQVSGTFKARGAFNRLLASATKRIVAASGGNHGIAVAYAARELGVEANIFVPQSAPLAKINTLRELGAQVHLMGTQYVEALEASLRFAELHQASISHAYDQFETLCGQGTVAKEWHSQAPHLDTVLVAVGGGGLIGGMAAWYRGDVKVVAVETLGCATLHQALAAGVPVDVAVSGLAADALGARRIGSLMFPIAQRYIASSVLVSDEAVRRAQGQAWQDFRLALEPAGAVAWAALSSGAYRPAAGERVGVLLCGANVDPALLHDSVPAPALT
jgi:threonine dehydratase